MFAAINNFSFLFTLAAVWSASTELCTRIPYTFALKVMHKYYLLIHAGLISSYKAKKIVSTKLNCQPIDN